MKRKFDWRSRLRTALASFHARPFQWGTTDCVVFASTCLEAMTGENILAGLSVPTYSDAKGAIGALQNLGYQSLEDFLSENFPRVAIAYAREGDIAIIDGPFTGTGLGIVLGERIGCITENGYGTVPRSRMKGAFSVP